MIKYLLVVFIISVSCYINGYSMGERPTVDQGEKAQPASDEAYVFTLPYLDGSGQLTLSDLNDKPVFLDFWASWCPPCRNAAPVVVSIAKQYEGKIHVVGVNLDNDPTSALRFLENMNHGYTQLKGAGSEVPQQYAVRGIPSFFIIDTDGKIVKRYVGFRRDFLSQWQHDINEVLK